MKRKQIDTALVLPPGLPLPPFVTDLSFHLTPALFLLVDTLLLSPPWPTTPMSPRAPMLTLTICGAVATAYWVWVEVCFAMNGFYPYPIFEVLNTWARAGLFVLSACTMWVVGGFVRTVYAVFNGLEGDRKSVV